MFSKIFSRRKPVELDDFCFGFFDQEIINIRVDGADLGQAFAKVVRDSVGEVDAPFLRFDANQLNKELIPLRFELFALAWLHEFGQAHVAAQSAFTRSYLEIIGHLDIWDLCEPYNQAIARASPLENTSETPQGRAYLAAQDRNRFDLFKKWASQGFDSTAVARAANRIESEKAWKAGLTAAFLMLTFCDRLGHPPNDEAQFRLIAVIRGLYDGARQEMAKVKITDP